jgi:hypothetical protein
LSLGNNVTDALLVKRMEFFQRYLCSFNSPEYAYLEQNEPLSTLKIVICSRDSFQNLTQFSIGKNVLGASSFNTDGCLWTDTCVLQISLIAIFWTSWSFSHLENYDFQDVFLSITKWILNEQQCTLSSCLLHNWFYFEGYMCSFKLDE